MPQTTTTAKVTVITQYTFRCPEVVGDTAVNLQCIRGTATVKRSITAFIKATAKQGITAFIAVSIKGIVAVATIVLVGIAKGTAAAAGSLRGSHRSRSCQLRRLGWGRVDRTTVLVKSRRIGAQCLLLSYALLIGHYRTLVMAVRFAKVLLASTRCHLLAILSADALYQHICPCK